jgi:hypothetical protein
VTRGRSPSVAGAGLALPAAGGGLTPRGAGAVMASRREPKDSLEFFPTPAWATRALCEWLVDQNPLPLLSEMSVWEPACGQGHMARPLAEYFATVHSSDVCRYGAGDVEDFLFPTDRRASWIVTNPPFRLGEQFAKTAIERADNGVALLVRTAFLESAARFESLFIRNPPCDILQFVERVPMFKGRVDPNGSTATAYCWLVWSTWSKEPNRSGTRFNWLRPCRKALERPGDYLTEEAAE